MNQSRRLGMTRLEPLVAIASMFVAFLLALGIVNLLVNYLDNPPRSPPALFTLHPRSSGRSSSLRAVLIHPDGHPREFEPRRRGHQRVRSAGVLDTALGPRRLTGNDRRIVEAAGFQGDLATRRVLRAAMKSGDSMTAFNHLVLQAMLFNSEGEPKRAYEVLEEARSLVETDDAPGAGMALHHHLLSGRGRDAPRRERELHRVPGRKLVHPAHRPGRRPHQPDRLPAGDPAFHRVPRAVPRRPRGPLAAQPGPHDPGRASRTRSIRGS